MNAIRAFLVFVVLPGIFAGIINYLFLRRKGYTAYSYLILGILAFTGLGFLIFKMLI